ncbi:hypothetical protein USDA257_c04530 [Sinorhizobium fredii USDA 257]|uniref:Uncharacterized protein n=1 Tax=Sinorhizobium fredii (strain USDA 257) TaxID=1185652 RepID=I3WZJ4_SINF2|nr:hypothetical protein USDA257_c04530 [Sinorhizobium fredii USDA 257]
MRFVGRNLKIRQTKLLNLRVDEVLDGGPTFYVLLIRDQENSVF